MAMENGPHFFGDLPRFTYQKWYCSMATSNKQRFLMTFGSLARNDGRRPVTETAGNGRKRPLPDPDSSSPTDRHFPPETARPHQRDTTVGGDLTILKNVSQW